MMMIVIAVAVVASDVSNSVSAFTVPAMLLILTSTFLDTFCRIPLDSDELFRTCSCLDCNVFCVHSSSEALSTLAA